MTAVAGFGIFRSALEEANELFDYELRSVAISVPQSVVADTKLANTQSESFEDLTDDRVVLQIWDASGGQSYRSPSGGMLPRQRPGI
ncbi:MULTISPECIES: sensor histidine kinase N-terminal domain-containing protein [unclassified Caballeronia]|uniref:sensor histidine kinase N-terminal domain-containing protein n=1 Tax=unclassified Caballeronia TaxID=2646786 RepID=UPI0028671D77|nr:MULTISPECIES: sensor histidine kinase N-terminal domain-containing protein [unclassified Caballeronia]MDR5751311.1 sensor histidine kinase N-terminal domain-containing protein [Caballeronia sp. LZ024]MDR5844551.1 sensor histidine kinase N-terminal domain-containing protein [Caballeronia sp. LZ031]